MPLWRLEAKKTAIKLSKEYVGLLLSEACDLAIADTDRAKAFKSPLSLTKIPHTPAISETGHWYLSSNAWGLS